HRGARGARGRRSRDPPAAQHGGPDRISPGRWREPPADRNRPPLTSPPHPLPSGSVPKPDSGRHPPRILILSSAAAEPRRVSKDATTSCSASTISARRAASVSDSSAIDERETGDVVGLLGAGSKFGGGSDDFFDELGGADAPPAIEDCFEPRFAENVSGRV